ncbi:MAG: hypothetical protein H7Y18_19400 [Clostridiaceae bacterium]|nr:hypothetical protein [Clostridiaceae bacterium]
MNKFNSFFKSSYGWDFLSKYLVILGLVLTLTRYTITLGLLLMIVATLRSFSKNKSKRYRELLTFENFLIKLKQKLNLYKNKFQQNKTYKILTCPTCSQKLRVPRKKGHITITCKKCGKKFEGKS